MESLINSVINTLLATEYAQYVLIALGAFYALSHVIAVLPPAWIGKIPSWLMSLINLIAANYKNTKNADVK